MTLANLLAINRLIAFAPDRDAVQRLLEAAARNLADAQVELISPENRFDAACKCIMQCAMVALWANGYRTATSQPGHHQTAIQVLPTTLGLPNATMVLLDALRKQRNLADYEGDPISPGAVAESGAELDDIGAGVAAHSSGWLGLNAGYRRGLTHLSSHAMRSICLLAGVSCPEVQSTIPFTRIGIFLIFLVFPVVNNQTGLMFNKQ